LGTERIKAGFQEEGFRLCGKEKDAMHILLKSLKGRSEGKKLCSKCLNRLQIM
jgi:hypothetical protein